MHARNETNKVTITRPHFCSFSLSLSIPLHFSCQRFGGGGEGGGGGTHGSQLIMFSPYLRVSLVYLWYSLSRLVFRARASDAAAC